MVHTAEQIMSKYAPAIPYNPLKVIDQKQQFIAPLNFDNLEASFSPMKVES